MDSSDQAPNPGRCRRAILSIRAFPWLGPALIGIAGIAMAAWTWGTWPDVQIDFGRELYVPWQLSQGKVLYRDIPHVYGPLSHYANALLFRCFGVGLQTLVLANLALLTLLLVLIYRLLTLVASRLAATVACLTFVLLFAFGQYVGVGNFNFVTPYSHEMTHAVILAFAAIALLAAHIRRRSPAMLFLSGTALGLCFLTKIEPFTAAAVALAAGLLLANLGTGTKRAGCEVCWFMAGQAIPPALAFALLLPHMGPNQAFRGVLGSWLYLSDSRLTGLPFYREGMGLANWQGSCTKMLVWATLYLAVFGLAALSASRSRFQRREAAVLAVVVFLLTLGSLAWCLPRLPWFDGLRPLPLVMAVAVLALLYRLYRQHRQNASADARALTVIQVTLCLFALALMLKEILNVRIYHYGFALSLPATLVAVCVLTDWIPTWVRKSGGSPAVFLALVGAIWLATVSVHLRAVNARISAKTVPVGVGKDAFLADGRGTFMAAALKEIETRLSPSQTLAVLPEGVMLNYLARRANPTPYVSFMPFEVILLGEEQMLAAFSHAPPDAVILAHRNTSEYGVAFFGRDYARGLFSWIIASYKPVWRVGAVPFVDEHFGVALLERKTAPGPVSGARAVGGSEGNSTLSTGKDRPPFGYSASTQ